MSTKVQHIVYLCIYHNHDPQELANYARLTLREVREVNENLARFRLTRAS